MERHERWLLALTALPTAAGCEARVVAWLRDWSARRRGVTARRDRFGNLELRRAGRPAARPLYLVAHMDHPAFVVHQVRGPRRLIAHFRGGVSDAYFRGARVRLHHADGSSDRGTVSAAPRAARGPAEARRAVSIRFERPVSAEPGAILTWDLGPPRFRGDRLHAPACDNLAGVAAAVAALDTVGRHPGVGLRVLFTRGEEVGFLGAIAACRARLLPRRARVIVLENSRSYADSPIGDGPVIRVGDRVSTFGPELTRRIAAIAAATGQRGPSFRWQRKLMPGGVCEASAFEAYGYETACICLPLGNYHNMNERTGRIAAETISRGDFHGLVRLLAAIARGLDDPAHATPMREKLEAMFQARRHVLD